MKTNLLFVAITSLLLSGELQAEFGPNALMRYLGLGWSDGYHAPRCHWPYAADCRSCAAGAVCPPGWVAPVVPHPSNKAVYSGATPAEAVRSPAVPATAAAYRGTHPWMRRLPPVAADDGHSAARRRPIPNQPF